MMRLTISDMMFVVLGLAIFMGSTLNANPAAVGGRFWALGLYLLTSVIFSVAVLRVLYGEKAKRAFWTGVLVFGSISLILGLLVLPGPPFPQTPMMAGVLLLAYSGGVSARNLSRAGSQG